MDRADFGVRVGEADQCETAEVGKKAAENVKIFSAPNDSGRNPGIDERISDAPESGRVARQDVFEKWWNTG